MVLIQNQTKAGSGGGTFNIRRPHAPIRPLKPDSLSPSPAVSGGGLKVWSESTRTEAAPDETQRRGQGIPSSSTLQPSGDREQVGQLESPGSPTESRAEPPIIAFLIYELLIQVSLGGGYALP